VKSNLNFVVPLWCAHDERRLMPLAFFALSFENELQYHCLNERINSRGDVAISCKNLVAYLVEYLRYTGSIFTIFSPYESALGADDGPLPSFPTCQGTLPWQPNSAAE